jgi:rubrerythrin
MLEQAFLREQFLALLDKERQAERLYADLSVRLSDPGLRRQIEQLHRDKQRHIALAERLLEIVE